MDIYINTGASDLLAATVTSLTDATAVTEFKQLVLRDSEPLNIYFMDGAAAESWSGDSTYTLSVGLGAAAPLGDQLYSSQSSFATIANGWTGRLSLNTDDLVNACYRHRISGALATVLPLVLHIRVTTPAGYTETHALVPVAVSYAVFPAATSPANDLSGTYYTAAQMKVLFPQLRADLTSLTGGGTLALDGIVTANNEQPSGAVVITAINGVWQGWLRRAGTDAEDGLTIIRPDDYDATTNAYVWALL